jgi:hypothetical protein
MTQMTSYLRPWRPLLLLLFLSAGCDDHHEIIVNLPTAPTPEVLSTIEFRVIGNANSVRIRHVNPVDGLTQVTTVLPYVVSLQTDQVVMFLSLDVTPISYPVGTFTPFLSAQIFVNGRLFREGSSADLLLTPISVSGTWRK